MHSDTAEGPTAPRPIATCPVQAGLIIDSQKSGKSLLTVLQDHYHLPETLVCRWMRTGQVRLNGRRVQPCDRVRIGDTIGLPQAWPITKMRVARR